MYFNYYYYFISGSTHECSLFRKMNKVAHKVKFGYNPQGNTPLDEMMKEQIKGKDGKEGMKVNLVSKYY